MGNPRPPSPLGGPAAWRGADLVEDDWLVRWTPRELDELARAVSSVRASGIDLARVGPRAERMPAVAGRMAAVRGELLRGRGFVVLRGLGVEPDDLAGAAIAFWLVGGLLGRALSQNARGHLLGHVANLGRSSEDPSARIYQTAERQGFHTDSADVVGLLCVAAAAAGGRSALCSATALHDELLLRAPDLCSELFEPFHTDHRGEEPPGAPPYFTAPVFTWHEGELSVMYQRRYIESAQRFAGVPPLSERGRAALDALDATADDPRVHLEMDLLPGDVQLVHNHALLHDRTAFRDDPTRGTRRHLLRLWLCPAEGRPLPGWFAERLGSVEPGRRGGVAPRAGEPFVTLDPRG